MTPKQKLDSAVAITKPVMRVTINYYNILADTPKTKAEYKALRREIAALGHECFKAISNGDYVNMPREQIIDTDYLFREQYNTVEGYRIFGWFERYNIDNPKRKSGYYLTGDLEAIERAKNDQYYCGFCQARYDVADLPTDGCCNKCLTSEYLTETFLPLLELLPVSVDRSKAAPSEIKPDLHARFLAAQPLIKERIENERLTRLRAKALRRISDCNEQAAVLQYEAKVRSQLLELGIDDENLIYYKHTNKWVFGWRDALSIEEIDRISAKISACREVLGAQWCDNVEFKQK